MLYIRVTLGGVIVVMNGRRVVTESCYGELLRRVVTESCDGEL